MQTPVFEAFTQTNANINYGLTSHTRTDLLYLPVLKANNLVNNAANLTSSVYYLAANSETASKLRTYHSASKYVLESNQVSDTQIILESGIDNNALTDNSTNRSAYIVNTNLLDTNFNVHADGRFIVSLLSAPKGGTFRNTSEGKSSVNLSPMKRVSPTSATSVLDNFNSYTSIGINNEVTQNDTVASTTISVLAGPRGTATALNFVIDSALTATSTGTRSSKYDLYGSYDQTVFGGGDKFDYIDTTVYVEGAISTGRLQLPIRIIRYAGT
jgi:hypothetical protein